MRDLQNTVQPEIQDSAKWLEVYIARLPSDIRKGLSGVGVDWIGKGQDKVRVFAYANDVNTGI